eukprot:GEMP01019511.1.p1 GENE.GEMP01019511.1~~GEMP01019511.1.p1  ORF type:complete len:501 (+),score=85.47 GEMP01019511.1:193-1695(+)
MLRPDTKRVYLSQRPKTQCTCNEATSGRRGVGSATGDDGAAPNVHCTSRFLPPAGATRPVAVANPHALPASEPHSARQTRPSAPAKEPASRRRSIPSPMEMVTNMLRYVEDKAEKTVFPEQSLPYMTARLDETQTQRRYTVPDSCMDTDMSCEVEVTLENKSRRCSITQCCPGGKTTEKITAEDLVADGEAKRSAFREELNIARRDRTSRKKQKRPTLARILHNMRFRKEENEYGERVNYDTYNHARFPWVIIVFLVVIAIIHVLRTTNLAASSWLKKNWSLMLATWENNGDAQCLRDARAELWRYLTYQLLHADLKHVASNSVVLLIIGSVFEWTHGHTNFVVVLLVGGIVGGITHVVYDPAIAVVGASGAAYAIAGAHIANVVINWNTMKWKSLGARLLFTICWAVWEIIDSNGIFDAEVATSTKSHAAHTGGCICGILLGVWFTDNLVLGKYDKYLKLGGVTLLSVLVVAAMIWIGLHDRSTCSKSESNLAGTMDRI